MKADPTHQKQAMDSTHLYPQAYVQHAALIPLAQSKRSLQFSYCLQPTGNPKEEHNYAISLKSETPCHQPSLYLQCGRMWFCQLQVLHPEAPSDP